MQQLSVVRAIEVPQNWIAGVMLEWICVLAGVPEVFAAACLISTYNFYVSRTIWGWNILRSARKVSNNPNSHPGSRARSPNAHTSMSPAPKNSSASWECSAGSIASQKSSTLVTTTKPTSSPSTLSAVHGCLITIFWSSIWRLGTSSWDRMRSPMTIRTGSRITRLFPAMVSRWLLKSLILKLIWTSSGLLPKSRSLSLGSCLQACGVSLISSLFPGAKSSLGWIEWQEIVTFVTLDISEWLFPINLPTLPTFQDAHAAQLNVGHATLLLTVRLASRVTDSQPKTHVLQLTIMSRSLWETLSMPLKGSAMPWMSLTSPMTKSFRSIQQTTPTRLTVRSESSSLTLTFFITLRWSWTQQLLRSLSTTSRLARLMPSLTLLTSGMKDVKATASKDGLSKSSHLSWPTFRLSLTWLWDS